MSENMAEVNGQDPLRKGALDDLELEFPLKPRNLSQSHGFAPKLHFAIIDTTLREGEQFMGANFSIDDKLEIARELDAFGVEYIETTSPVASPDSLKACMQLAKLDIKAKVLTHIRCHMDDAKVAVDTGVAGINMVIGTSPLIRQHGHGKTKTSDIIQTAAEVLTFVRQQRPDIELRFSTEDSFRTPTRELLRVYIAVDRLNVVNRLGTADTVGVASPHQVYKLINTINLFTDTDIEFHGHNDTGCAIANSYAALEAGGTHINTCILGIGERNGITPLSGFVARMYASNPEHIRTKYDLHHLHVLDEMIARKVGVSIPFNNYITGASAFVHKAGIHTKAVLQNPKTYEILDPDDFGMTRHVIVAHKLTGWHAISNRALQLGLTLSDEQIKTITTQVKALGDGQTLTLAEVDRLLQIG